MDRKRMNATSKFRRERRIYHAVALDAALPLEGRRYDIDPEMCLPARPMSGMAFMLVGFIGHTQAFRRESLRQLLRDDVGCPHLLGLSEGGAGGQQ